MWGIILIIPCLFMALAEAGEVYKYQDLRGRLYFSNAPLSAKGLKLEWKRDEKDLGAKNLDIVLISQARSARERALPLKNSAGRGQYDGLIKTIAIEEQIHPELLHAVARTESGYRYQAVSPAGARGIMQLMPATARHFDVKNLHDPAENLRGGARYLRHLLDLFDNDLQLSLAAYNAGEYASALRDGRIPSNGETRGFVRKVIANLTDEMMRHNKSTPRTLQAASQPEKSAQDNSLLTNFSRSARLFADLFQ